MIKYFKLDRWSSYLVGIFIGILSWITFYFMNHQIGTTDTIQKTAAVIIGLFSEKYIVNSKYYMFYLQNSVFSWQMAFVIFIFLGSFVASKLSKEKRLEHIPKIWQLNFGDKKWKRYLGAFIGGMILIFGARFADGCTSGHAISGGLQLAVSGWIFICFVFISAITTSLLIYKKN